MRPGYIEGQAVWAMWAPWKNAWVYGTSKEAGWSGGMGAEKKKINHELSAQGSSQTRPGNVQKELELGRQRHGYKAQLWLSPSSVYVTLSLSFFPPL